MEPARPANSELASQLNNMGELLREINAYGDASSAGMKEEIIYTPLRQILSNMTANTLSQPGVNQSLKDLKKIMQADRNADDIIVRIESLSSLSNVAPAAKEAPPKSPGVAPKNVEPPSVKELSVKFTRIEDDEVNIHGSIHGDLPGQLQKLVDNLKFYQERLDITPDRRARDNDKFGYRPIERILDQLSGLSEAESRNLISQPGVKEALIAAFAAANRDNLDPHPEIAEKLGAAIRRFAPKAQAVPLREIFEPPANAASEAVAAPPNADVLSAALSSGYIEGQPSREERGKIDQLAGFIGAVQRGNHSEDFLMNISIGISDIPENPHPEVGVLLKELAAALKEVKDPTNMNNVLVDRLERKSQQFGVPPAAAQPASAPERAEVPAAAQPARPPVVDEQADLEKRLAGLELVDQQIVRFFPQEVRDIINERNDRDFIIRSEDLLRELESRSIDVLARLPNLELVDQMTARIRGIPGREALTERWEDLRNDSKNYRM